MSSVPTSLPTLDDIILNMCNILYRFNIMLDIDRVFKYELNDNPSKFCFFNTKKTPKFLSKEGFTFLCVLSKSHIESFKKEINSFILINQNNIYCFF